MPVIGPRPAGTPALPIQWRRRCVTEIAKQSTNRQLVPRPEPGNQRIKNNLAHVARFVKKRTFPAGIHSFTRGIFSFLSLRGVKRRSNLNA